MGTVRRPKPKRLAEKLLQVRLSLGLSQNELIKRLDFEKELVQGTISTYELGKREPSLPLLLKYAQIAGICVDVIINDELDLPKKLPSKPSSRIHFCTFDSLDRILLDYDNLHDLNVASFNLALHNFYEGIFEDYQRSEILKQEFESRILGLYNYYFRQEFGAGYKFQHVFFNKPNGVATLEIGMELNISDTDKIDFFNSHEGIKKLTEVALMNVYRYSGEFVFTIEIPF